MRKIVLLVIFLSIGYVHAQDVSVSLSIVWKSENVSIDSNMVMDVPYLNITYMNNTGKAVYFHSISVNEEGIPCFPMSMTFSDKYGFEQLNDYSNAEYKVVIEDNSDLLSTWMVIPNSTFYDKEHEVDFINDELTLIYSRLKKDTKTELPIDTIDGEKAFWEKISNHFVFLKADDIYTDSFNLYGFLKLHGIYEFQMVSCDKELRNYVSVFMLLDKFVCVKKKLPIQINGYQLYDKPLEGSSIKVKF